jgi:hypothetical protein
MASAKLLEYFCLGVLLLQNLNEKIPYIQMGKIAKHRKNIVIMDLVW